PRMSFLGLRARVGDATTTDPFAEVESILVNAPAARTFLDERNDLRLLGWTLYGAGLGLMLGDTTWVLSGVGRGTLAPDWPISFIAVLGGATVIAIVGAIFAGLGETRTWRALEAYHQWLWRTLALPRDAVQEPEP